ncbi:acyl carrier protein [Streptomyces triticirhizae]|uniref:Carrier domain-containing protein n=1 Tax=Streptomyces triticirhizae TaxID=2483353 RepID=A0A3M2M5E9_9ACTN|nr:acyl carrier protein [Streptomyces triticirhizae]RMI44806.1 hypothetical protein EBN88_04755 [Streptomyces triticirhizae]
MTDTPVALSERETAELVARLVAADLDLPEGQRVDHDTPFTDLGLDSAGVLAVAGELSDALGVEVPPEWLFDHATVAALARHLAAEARTSGGADG